ncbi:thiamine-phosphate kinase [Leeia sp. TBRC 13508]|uniref:Thiamine-monophosphate kinase n=1 Tax=Leeia speluncae TaxID=2884804 RepID=A0ABS8D3A1_9NEIS|nr:thiamine-phosphate kinase [Leeia speluncae]MCB6182471.1 thiamine-phosphate kinase [Leeia speluncae]
MSEFDTIRRYFTRPARSTDLAVGDDAALISIPSEYQLAISADMLVSGRHFFADVDPFLLGRKSLAVNLSDMAAMGAIPRWFTLAISLPTIDDAWLAAFSEGLFSIAEEHQVDLIGGDTTAGPLTISIQIMGLVPKHQAILRSGAKLGDDIWVTGNLGNAALALQELLGNLNITDKAEIDYLRSYLENPTPRCALGAELLEIASAMLDISDGLAGDLAHIAKASHLTARVQSCDVPVSNVVKRYQSFDGWESAVLAGGDDYELCFTANPSHRLAIHALSKKHQLAITRIGSMIEQEAKAVRFMRGDAPLQQSLQAFDHFST